MAVVWTTVFSLLLLAATADRQPGGEEGAVLLQRTSRRAGKAALDDENTTMDEHTEAAAMGLIDESRTGFLPQVFEKAQTMWADVRDTTLAQLNERLGTDLGTPGGNGKYKLLFFEGLCTLLIWVIVAYFYNMYRLGLVFDKEGMQMGGEIQGVFGHFVHGGADFTHGLFGCLGDMKICCLSFCCFPIRWADTLDKTNPRLVQYWAGFAIMGLLVCFAPLTGSISSLVAVLVGAFYRQQLRIHFGIQNGGMTWVYDVLTYLCCGPCAATQEARQVEACRTPV